jgi:hypothetical protein
MEVRSSFIKIIIFLDVTLCGSALLITFATINVY